jgi:hypothetical protein
MAYKSYKVAAQALATTPKDEMLNAYQSAIDDSFLLATDWFTISEEDMTTYAYSDVTVRLNTVYGESGSKLSDDYREIIFQDMEHTRGLGTKFQFNGSYWLTINYDEYGKPTASVVIQKCRNILKWVDKQTGAVLSEPCVFDFLAEQRARPVYNKYITIPDGYTSVAIQYNDNTSQIKINDRFYFNGKCYRVTDIYNVLNNPTDGKPPLLYLIMYIDQINAQKDDVTNGIANYNDYDYSIIINQAGFSGIVGTTGTLTATVTLNGTVVSRDVTWTSDSTAVTIDSSTGVYTFASIGTANITATLGNNTSKTAIVVMNVVATVPDNYYVKVLPDQRYILQNDSLTFIVYRYNNETAQGDTFTCTASGSGSNCYTLDSIDGNHFKVYNLLKSSTPLMLTFKDVTNVVDDTVISVTLKGVF